MNSSTYRNDDYSLWINNKIFMPYVSIDYIRYLHTDVHVKLTTVHHNGIDFFISFPNNCTLNIRKVYSSKQDDINNSIEFITLTNCEKLKLTTNAIMINSSSDRALIKYKIIIKANIIHNFLFTR